MPSWSGNKDTAHAPPPPNAPPIDERKPWLTLADVADELDVSSRTVMRWVQRGHLPAVILPGGRTRISRHAFDQWLASLPRAGHPAAGGRLDARRLGRAKP